jgi:hypothetical protein
MHEGTAVQMTSVQPRLLHRPHVSVKRRPFLRVESEDPNALNDDFRSASNLDPATRFWGGRRQGLHRLD